MYGTVRTVVWADGRGNPPSDPIAADVYEGRRVAILTRRERIKRRTLLGSHSLLLREGVIPWTGGLERAE